MFTDNWFGWRFRSLFFSFCFSVLGAMPQAMKSQPFRLKGKAFFDIVRYGKILN
jgi:hypothetical protein